jgi:hypothetical protein
MNTVIDFTQPPSASIPRRVWTTVFATARGFERVVECEKIDEPDEYGCIAVRIGELEARLGKGQYWDSHEKACAEASALRDQEVIDLQGKIHTLERDIQRLKKLSFTSGE